MIDGSGWYSFVKKIVLGIFLGCTEETYETLPFFNTIAWELIRASRYSEMLSCQVSPWYIRFLSYHYHYHHNPSPCITNVWYILDSQKSIDDISFVSSRISLLRRWTLQYLAFIIFESSTMMIKNNTIIISLQFSIKNIKVLFLCVIITIFIFSFFPFISGIFWL